MILLFNLSLTWHKQVLIMSWKISCHHFNQFIYKMQMLHVHKNDPCISSLEPVYKWSVFFFTGQRVHFQVLSCNQVSLQASLEVLSRTSCVFQVGSFMLFQFSTIDLLVAYNYIIYKPIISDIQLHHIQTNNWWNTSTPPTNQ